MTEPALYVGTYAKYNNGSIEGAWLKLFDYDNRKEFYDACRKLHKDEADPEIMFQDHENLPSNMYSESGAPPDELWELKEYDENERKQIYSYWCEVDSSANAKTILDIHCGEWDNWDDYVYHYVDICIDIPDHLSLYFDYKKFGDTLLYKYEVTDSGRGVYIFHKY